MFSRLLLPLLLCGSLAAAESTRPAPKAEAPDRAAVREALARATGFLRSIAVEGGYVWTYSADLTQRAGEEPTSATQIWVQPPGTPAVGQMFLQAWAATGDPVHLEAARSAAEALSRGQLESGGWDYRVEFEPALRGAWRYREDAAMANTPATTGRQRKNVTTFDDNNTQSALTFLLAFVDAAKSAPDPRDDRIRAALDYGLRKFLEAQYPGGGWPQRWDGRPHEPAEHPIIPATLPADYPREQPKTGYYQHYTFNDGTHRDALLLCLEAHRRTGRPEFREAARRAADFILLAQLPEPQPAWAQQYDAAMHPAWARAFEPPAVSAGESAGIIRLLLDLRREFDDERYLKAAGRAVAWLRRSEIAPGRWARLYELETNRPLYGDRDGRIHHTLAEISEERQRGYGWEGSFDIPGAIAAYEDAAAGRPTSEVEARPGGTQRRMNRSDARVTAILAAQDDKGRWLDVAEGERLETRRFLANMRVLCAFLQPVSP